MSTSPVTLPACATASRMRAWAGDAPGYHAAPAGEPLGFAIAEA